MVGFGKGRWWADANSPFWHVFGASPARFHAETHLKVCCSQLKVYTAGSAALTQTCA